MHPFHIMLSYFSFHSSVFIFYETHYCWKWRKNEENIQKIKDFCYFFLLLWIRLRCIFCVVAVSFIFVIFILFWLVKQSLSRCVCVCVFLFRLIADSILLKTENKLLLSVVKFVGKGAYAMLERMHMSECVRGEKKIDRKRKRKQKWG